MTDERIDVCTRLLLAAARETCMAISGDQRVAEQDAARLLGLAPGYLKQMRQESKGPTPYGRGMNGCRISYRVTDLAGWIEAGREDY